jgi:parvulin-like peptidyl-prolyl isomerase
MRLHIWALAALAGAAGLVVSANPARAQTDPKTVVATVNGRSITLGEVETVIKARNMPTGDAVGEARKRLVYEVTCMLIDGVLWEQYLQKNGPRIDPAEVKKHMDELEREVKKHNKTMADYYKDSGQTEATVRSGIVSILQWEAIARKKLGDAEVKRYYDENKDFFDMVKVRASAIMLKVPASASDADKQAAREKLLAIRAHVVAGTLDFAEAARRYSQDATAAEGGDLGFFPRKMVYEEGIARTAFSLPVNAVSDVVQCEYGMYLIKVMERKAAEQQSDYEKIKDGVRDLCTAELQLAVMSDLRKSARVQFNLPK